MHRRLIRLGAKAPRRVLITAAVGLVALIAVGASSAYVVAGRPAAVAASNDTSPNPTGSWALTDTYDNVAPTSPYRTGYDTVTFTPTSPGVYTITNAQANGGGSSGVEVSGDSFMYEVCGASAGGAIYPEGDCPANSGHFEESWEFDYTGSTYTATGSFQQYAADGSTDDQQYGTFTATGPASSAEPSATKVKCAASGQSTQCTATVSDAGSAGLTPTGSVTFSASAGSFATDTCTLEAAAAGAACSADYTPPSSGTSTSPTTITATYDGDDNFSGSSGVTTLTGMSGTIENSCGCGGLGGFTVLVKGTASNGTAVSETDVSDGDGSWSVGVPPGSYTAGLTADGSTFASDALEKRDITVGDVFVSGVDFIACAESSGGDASSGDFGPGVAAGDGGLLARDAEASFKPTLCQSEYTVKVTAKIPQPILVDASEDAHYREASGDGYNHSLTFLNTLRQKFKEGAGFNTEFPLCMSAQDVHRYSALKATPEWYSYIEAGNVIGSATVPLTWNQQTQDVKLESVPTVTHGSVTRMFVWQVKLPNGNVEHGSCPEKVQVPMLVLPVAGAGESETTEGGGSEARDAEVEGDVPPQSFTIIAAWWLPFDSYGATIDPSTSFAERVIDGTLGLTRKLFKVLGAEGNDLLAGYERLPAYQKFVVELVAGAAIGYGEEKAAVEGPQLLTEFFKGRKVTAATLEELEKLGTAMKYIEYGVKVPLEAASVIEGYTAYPVFSAVIRGAFTTTKSLPSTEAYDVNGKPKLLPYQETLAVSVQSTKFPNISVEMSRNANPSCFAGCEVFEGTLPWKTDLGGGFPEVNNPFSATNPAYFVSDSAKTGHSYVRGLSAVRNVIADTSQTPEVAYSLRKKGNLASQFAAEQEEAPDPDCYPDDLDTGNLKTICWEFEDTRP
jgi:hypothetical protein